MLSRDRLLGELCAAVTTAGAVVWDRGRGGEGKSTLVYLLLRELVGSPQYEAIGVVEV